MRTIVTPQEVVSLAFVDEGLVTMSKISLTDIAVAESRYLLPLVGEELYEKLLNGEYTSLRDDYVKPMVALWARYVAEPLLEERLGGGYGDKYTEADVEAREVVVVRLRRTASALSRRLSDYLNAHCEEFVEYNPADNPLNHCVIDGGIVQIF